MRQNYLAKLLDPKLNGPEITSLLAELLEVKISEGTIKKELEQHPNYPSLLSISDVLNNYGIENLTVNVDDDKIAKASVPFITQIKGAKSNTDFFTVVKGIGDDSIHYFDPESQRWRFSSLPDFIKKCSGIVLLTEVKDGAGEKEYLEKVSEEKRRRRAQNFTIFCIPAIVLVAGVIAFLQNGTGALLPFIFSVFTLAGAVLGVLLIWHELDQYNPVLQQICRAGRKVNCSGVLQSKGAKIAGVSWTSIGFSYFIGELLLLMFGGITSLQTLFVVGCFNVLAVPYIFYSVYYQWRIAKQWCILCLCVQGLLILQLAVTLGGNWLTSRFAGNIAPELYLQIITSFSIPFITIAILLPALLNSKERNRINIELQKLKHNPQIFETLLVKQKTFVESVEGLGIRLGNPNATYKIIKVCNPYCGPCAQAHAPLEELLHNNPDLQIQILFTATNNEDDITASTVRHLLAIAEKNEEAIIRQALDDWYLADTKDYNIFAERYPMNGELTRQSAKIAAMRSWCDKVAIGFTPTFFIALPANNLDETIAYYQLPDIYSITDLKYFFSV
ncbi:MAG TPA: vitamin K epoxide reductase family protein [Mucilaginibacter sp.]|jgi:uncharacterized membrane protein